MERSLIPQLPKKKLLLNAEPFGFGPASAVAAIFPHLKGKFAKISYAGEGLTLDIQKKLPYDEIYDLGKLKGPALDRKIKELAAEYDVVFTAMDFPLLTRFKACGMRTCGYDALTWFWPKLDKAAQSADLYLAQDFFGVKKRLHKEKDKFNLSALVPPLVKPEEPAAARDVVLINFGGLQNFHWSRAQTVAYARKMLAAIKPLLSPKDKVKVATSASVAKALGIEAITYSRSEMKEILRHTKRAFMTPGLGNIYDAAVHNVPTVWLPPANDSQGRQLMLLRRHGFVDGSVDWNDLASTKLVNYAAMQESLMNQLSELVTSSNLVDLRRAIAIQDIKVRRRKSSRVRGLLDLFGSGGEAKVAKHIIEFSNEE
jgi:hypothetical protein